MYKADLIGKIVKKCYEISTKSKADVFFNYYPHCNTYEIKYHLEGWDYNSKGTYLTDDAIIDDIYNLEKTLKELDKLWESIEENNSSKNCKDNLNN